MMIDGPEEDRIAAVVFAGLAFIISVIALGVAAFALIRTL
jgi:hypothetical protein